MRSVSLKFSKTSNFSVEQLFSMLSLGMNMRPRAYVTTDWWPCSQRFSSALTEMRCNHYHKQIMFVEFGFSSSRIFTKALILSFTWCIIQ